MKVIFLSDLRGQGRKGEIKEVKDGYAKNFLIAKGYAEQLTEQSLGKYNREKQKAKDEDVKKQEEALKNKEKLEKEELFFKVKTGDKDKVFGSVSSKQIKDELDKKGYQIDKKQIDSQTALSSLGQHYVNINLYKEVFAKIRVTLQK